MEAIGALLDQAIARNPQRPRTPTDAWWWPAHLGGSAPIAMEPGSV
jgi:hypothetical protein